METTLKEILDAREQRVKTQQSLLEQYKKPLVCFTMNIPGPEKYNRDIAIGFSVGNWLLQRLLKGHRLLHRQTLFQNTGCEGYYVVDLPATALKKIAIQVENTDGIGRLFDCDVLDTDGRKLTREEVGIPRRKCLICDNEAAICARSRAHGLPALQERINALLQDAATNWMCEYIAAQAYLALMQEVSTTPKPGLVDRNNRGSHPDMDIGLFFASAGALRPFLCEFARQGYLTRDLQPTETFRGIRPIGMDAESAMYAATGGINTHKGAIFSLGIACAAAGRLSPEDWTPERLCAECAAMSAGVVQQDFAGITTENAKTAGEKIFVSYGITGVRGQAEAGFPAVLQSGLPVLRQGLSQGLSLNDAGCTALLHLLAATDDTNLIHRSNRQTQLKIKEEISALLSAEPFPSLETVRQLDKDFIQKNLSAGGSADLLAITYFFLFLCNK